jgi:hypothetical protein
MTTLDIVKSYNEGLVERMMDWDAMRAHLVAHIAASATCVEPPSLPWGGTWTGPDGWIELFKKAMGIFAASSVTPGEGGPDRYITQGTTVVHRYSMSVTVNATGARGDFEGVEIYEVIDDKIRSCDVFLYDPVRLQSMLTASA